MPIEKIILGLTDIRVNDYDNGSYEDEVILSAIKILEEIAKEEV